MRVSVALPTAMEGMIYPAPFAGPADLVRIAQRAEALGYEAVWGNDHLTTQRYVRREGGPPPNYWSPLVTYAFLAARTERLRLATGVLVAPLWRDIVVLAKQVCTLDHFSGGRLVLGVGVGAYREEFEAVFPRRKERRGEILDEFLEAFPRLLQDRVASYNGRHYRFQDVEMYPKPRQDPLPLYVGGNHPRAAARAGRFGQGWLPAALPVAALRERLEHLRRAAEGAGRDPAALDIAPQMVVRLGRTSEAARRGFRESQMMRHLLSLRRSTLRGQQAEAFETANLIGTPQEVIDRALALRAAGVTHLAALLFAVDSLSELLDQMAWFQEAVVPALGGAA